jgi:hypothetical protein
MAEPATSTGDAEGQAAEVERLRVQVAALEARLVEVEDWANRAVGAAQERLYWLDRWQIDLNRLMTRRGAAEFRAAVRALRAVYRWAKRLKRQQFPAA